MTECSGSTTRRNPRPSRLPIAESRSSVYPEAVMPKWSKQEQDILLILLVIVFTGLAGQIWLKSRPGTPSRARSAAVSPN